MTLRMLFVCMFVLGLSSISETNITWNKRSDRVTFSLPEE